MLGGQHVMLSYDSNSQDIVQKIYNILEKENITAWFRLDGDTNSHMYERLADGVEKAAVICCFMTPNYQKSENCKLELQYAQKRHKRIIPCMLTNTKIWKASDWLEIITKEHVYIDFDDISEENLDSKVRKLITRISEQLPALHIAPSQSIDEPSYIFELIKHQHARSRIERLINPAESCSVEENYINLVVRGIKGQKKIEKNCRKVEQSEVMTDNVEEIYSINTPVRVKNIFRICQHRRKRVLVSGQAGIGKSTFCQYAAHQWAAGALWSEFDLVILFPLRSLTETRYPPLPANNSYSLMNLVDKEYFWYGLSDTDKSLLQKQLPNSKVLWLLDGYNEIMQTVPRHLQPLLDQLFKTPYHIVTSRPYFNSLSYIVQMEITGFTDNNIGHYTKHFFNQTKDDLQNSLAEDEKLLNFLKASSSIWDFAHTPINLEIICSLWSDKDYPKTKILTMTALYDEITQWLCRRYLTKKNKNNEHMHREAVYAHCQKELAFLGTLAYHGMENNTIYMGSDLLKKVQMENQCFLEKHSQLLNIGVLKSMNDHPLGCHIQTENKYYFIHLTFQEYFAACYIVQAFSGSERQTAIDFIKSHKDDQRFALVFSFASGLLAEIIDEESNNTFWHTILDEPYDLDDSPHLQIVVSCFHEALSSYTTHKRGRLIKFITNWIEYTSLRDQPIFRQKIESIIRSCTLLTDVPEIQETLIQHLETQDSNMKRNIVWLINILQISKPPTRIIVFLINQLQDHYIRTKACDTLEKIAKKEEGSTVISQLVTALGNNNNNETMRLGVCEVLAKIGERRATEEIINGLIVVLGDGTMNIRCSARQALAKIGEKTAPSDVIRKLVTALENNNEKVRWDACHVLRKLSEKRVTTDLIAGLSMALCDNDASVRWSACEALSRLGENAENDIISWLLTALRHINEKVRLGACEALAKIGEKTATEEMISGLVTALRDPEWSIRTSACKALGTIGEKTTTTEVISQLALALGDSNSSVKKSACDALGKIREKAATAEVISRLIIALKDNDDCVRLSACHALSKIAAKAGNDTVSQLITALGHNCKTVRYGVSKALANISETETIKEIVSQLIAILGNGRENIRLVVCEVLKKLAENKGRSEVIAQLVTVLRHNDSDVVWHACEALGNITTKRATSEVITGLLIALENNESMVGVCASRALARIGEEEGRSEVIHRLVIALQQSNVQVSLRACEVLAKIAEMKRNCQVISALVIAVEHSDAIVKLQACNALGRLGEMVARPDVINALLIAVEDSDSRVRASACNALGNIRDKTAATKVISPLLMKLEDSNKDVRASACEALGNIAVKTAATEVISPLLMTLDDHPCVREKAYIALGKISEKEERSEVLSRLIMALGDGDCSIRLIAFEALRRIAKNRATKELISQLTTALEHNNKTLKFNARQLLDKIAEYRRNN